MNHDENLGRILRSLNSTLTAIIGPDVFINVRRTTTDLRDDLSRIHSDPVNSEYIPCYSGSKAEGLRFESSDDDWMFIHRHIKVIPSENMAMYDSNTTLLLMENEKTKPGFSLLRLIGESTKSVVTRSTEHILNGRYLSCKRWRESHTAGYRGPGCGERFTHGPCTSGMVGPTIEYDFAYCIKCDIWPANAQDCIKRLH